MFFSMFSPSNILHWSCFILMQFTTFSIYKIIFTKWWELSLTIFYFLYNISVITFKSHLFWNLLSFWFYSTKQIFAFFLNFSDKSFSFLRFGGSKGFHSCGITTMNSNTFFWLFSFFNLRIFFPRNYRKSIIF